MTEVTLWVSIMMGSLLGSLHCAAMCGAFACMSGTGSRQWLLYHATRLLGYMMWGALAGALGNGLQMISPLVDLGLGIGIAVAMGVVGVLVLLGRSSLHIAWPMPIWISERLVRQRGWVRAVSLGAVSAILPCGWLWVFVLSAASAPGVIAGGMRMAAFWVGTVPLLWGVQWASGRLGHRLPPVPRAVQGIVLLMVALMMVMVKIDPGMNGKSGTTGVGPMCVWPIAR